MIRKEDRRLRVGVLGCGPIAQFAHLESCVKARNADLYAICDAAPDLLARMGATYEPEKMYADYDAMLADPALARFFAGHSTDSKGRIRQLVVEQLCAATGGPCVYTGRDMKTSHAGLGITEAEWNASVAHLVASLDKFKVPQAEKDELLAMASSLEADIVDSP